MAQSSREQERAMPIEGEELVIGQRGTAEYCEAQKVQEVK